MIGRLGSQFFDGAQAEIDRKGRQMRRFERHPVGLYRGFVKTLGLRLGTPPLEVVERLFIGAFGVAGADAIEDQALDPLPDRLLFPRARARRARSRRLAQKLELDGNAGVLLFPQRNERLGNPDPQGRHTVQAGVAGGTHRN